MAVAIRLSFPLSFFHLYVAVSVASALEAEGLLGTMTPDLVLVCRMPAGYEQETEQLRTTYQLAGTLVLVGRDQPDPAWAALWHVDLCQADQMDARARRDSPAVAAGQRETVTIDTSLC